MASRDTALRSLRVADRAHQLGEPEVPEGLARPALRLTWLKMTPLRARRRYA